jgi:hypothetical protein
MGQSVLCVLSEAFTNAQKIYNQNKYHRNSSYISLHPKSRLAGTEGRMTGGGSVFFGNMRVTHGFELHCNPALGPNTLEVNWNGNSFHLTTLTNAICWNTGISPAPPAAPFDQYYGSGTGKYNGVDGFSANWQFTDHGEPGKNNDAISYLIISDSAGNVVLNLSPTGGPYLLDSGNHQAHAQN